MTTFEEFKEKYGIEIEELTPEEQLELAEKYISEWDLSPKAQEKLLNTPGLVDKHIENTCISSALREMIINNCK